MPSQTLEQILDGRRSQPNQLIEVLQDVQENYGYISKEAIQTVSQDLGIPLMEVYRVASFYKAFKLKPCGKNHLIMCMGTACHVRGAVKVLESIEKQLKIKKGETTKNLKFTLETVNCVGACALGPMVIIGEDYHGEMTPEGIIPVLEQYN